MTATLAATVAENSSDRYRTWLVAVVLTFAPLFRASNRPLPLMLMELASLGLILLAVWRWQDNRALPRGLKWALLALLLLPALYLFPIPNASWALFPGRALYSEVLNLVSPEHAWRALSIYPLQSEAAWYALLPPVAVFLAAVALPLRDVKPLVVFVLVVGAAQAVLGLMQYGSGSDSPLRLGNPFNMDAAVGTFINRNHLAGFLEMLLPVGLALLAANVGRTQRALRYHPNWRSRLGDLSSWRMNVAVVYGAISLMILLGLVFTRSRSGVALGMLAIVLAALAFARRLGGTNAFGIVGVFTSIGVSLATLIGLTPILQRFTLQDPLEDLRWSIYQSTLQGIGHFFPLGSGPGTFPYVYPLFQTAEQQAGFINHAHNDYLEWLFESGLFAVGIIAVLAWYFVRRWPQVWTRSEWSTLRFAQVGAGIGVLLMALHGLTDFNLHIPANAVYFAFLAGIFFHPGDEPVTTQAPQSERPRASSTLQPIATVRAAPPAQMPNPFAE